MVTVRKLEYLGKQGTKKSRSEDEIERKTVVKGIGQTVEEAMNNARP